MARGVNGYVTVNVGVANGHARVGESATLKEDERHRRARRLRKEGWSYRRIAAGLNMTYASVCQLLDGDESRLLSAPASVLPPPLPRRATTAPPAVAMPPVAAVPVRAEPAQATTAARLEEMAAQIVVLHQRLDTVLALNEGHRQSLARLERSMVATLQSEHRALGQRLQTAIKGVLERMIPSSLRAWSPPADRTPDDQG